MWFVGEGQATATVDPCGMTDKRSDDGNSNGEMRGSVRLRCSRSAVRNFAQDDTGFGGSAKTVRSKDEIQGSLATLKDDDVKQATASATAEPCGMTNKGTGNGKGNGKCKGEMRGSVRLRCSRSAVSNFAQDDVRSFRRSGENRQRQRQQGRATATATAKKQRQKSKGKKQRQRQLRVPADGER